MAVAGSLPSPLESYPKLKAFHVRMKSLPQLQPYFASPAYEYIVNNKMAHFK